MTESEKRNHEFDSARHAIDLLQGKSAEEQRAIIRSMTPHDALMFDADFETWAHEGQRPPPGEGWRTWLMMAGRGFGKTRAGAEWIHRLATGRAEMRIALIGASIDETRRIMVEGVSGLISIARRQKKRIYWEPSQNRLRWPNGSEAQLFSGDNPDGLRGPEHDVAWADELAKWRQAPAAWDNLQIGLRRGSRPRALVTTTPRPIELLRRIEVGTWTMTTTGRTSDNVNLDEKYVEVMRATYGGTRFGRQELDGELIADVEGALWSWALIERSRVAAFQMGPSTAFGGPPPRGKLGEEFDRIVVGVDPPAGVGGKADACGIIVAASQGHRLYVLEDASVQGLSPEGWANRVAAAALRWGATTIVAEANNGGAMVKSVIDAAGAPLKVRLVHASQGKAARAEPVALRFERGEVFLAGEFAELEAELAGIQAGGGYEPGSGSGPGGPGRSPDRADAMVWALTALSETKSGVPRVRRL